MHQTDRSLAPQRVSRTIAPWTVRVIVAAGALCAVTPLAIAADASLSCPAGQMAATRIDYEGQYNLDPAVDMFNFHALTPNVGYTRRTVLVANGGHYKETSEGTIVVVKDKGPGKLIPGTELFAREFPSRFVIVETPQQKLVYDEQGNPENLGTRRKKSKDVSAADERMIVGALQGALAPSADKTAVIGKATYAGIDCEVRRFLTPGSSVCVGTVRGQYVTLAEEQKVGARPEPSRMQAKSKADVCVSAREFEAPAHVRFK